MAKNKDKTPWLSSFKGIGKNFLKTMKGENWQT